MTEKPQLAHAVDLAQRARELYDELLVSDVDDYLLSMAGSLADDLHQNAQVLRQKLAEAEKQKTCCGKKDDRTFACGKYVVLKELLGEK